MNNTPNADVLLSSFPPSLAVDTNKYALARVIAEELRSLLSDCDKLRIYSRIDELDEKMLDILAFDFAVTWYLYNGTLETKRAQIKSCFYVHRHLGTKAAMVTALSDLCPGSNVEEWYDYGGEPYYFRLVVDLTEQRMPIVQSNIERYISIFKSLRSVLEENSVIYKSRANIGIKVTEEFFVYGAPSASENADVRSGVYPEKTLLSSKVKEVL